MGGNRHSSVGEIVYINRAKSLSGSFAFAFYYWTLQHQEVRKGYFSGRLFFSLISRRGFPETVLETCRLRTAGVVDKTYPRIILSPATITDGRVKERAENNSENYPRETKRKRSKYAKARIRFYRHTIMYRVSQN